MSEILETALHQSWEGAELYIWPKRKLSLHQLLASYRVNQLNLSRLGSAFPLDTEKFGSSSEP